MESTSGDGTLAKERRPGLDKKCRLHVLCRRKRLADPDGISVKAAIDGLVEAGILRDDNAECVKEVSISQEKCRPGEEEQTIVRVYV